MKQGFLHRLDVWARGLTPFALAALLVVLGLMPLRLASFSSISPWFLLMAVFFWTAHRPDLLPPWAVFLLGLFADLAAGAPVGVSSLALLAVQWAVRTQRRHILPQSFIVQWVIFAGFALLAELLFFLLHLFALEAPLDPRPALFQALMTIAVYPCVAWVFVQAQRAFLKPS